MKGNDTALGIGILILLFFVMLVGPKGTPNSSSATNTTTSNTGGTAVLKPSSSYSKSISISTGNAAYSYQPYEEYITIYSSDRNPVDITGWQLKNNKNERAYDFGGSLRHFPSDSATIPRAALFVSPTGANLLQNVVLGAGETAIVTTGQMNQQSPFRIVSFKENICSGYLEDMPEYAFTPPLNRQCPRPATELGVTGLDIECRQFIERMAPCHTPKFDTLDREGDICYNCVDGKPLSGSCVAFIKNHYNYSSCIASHSKDANFSGQTWRIFLGKGWEMWGTKYETIQLLDRFGQLVNSRGY